MKQFLTEQEWLWIVAHEAAHYAHSHGWRKTGMEVAIRAISAVPAALYVAIFVWQLKRSNELGTKALWKNMLNGGAVGLCAGVYAINNYVSSRPALNGYAKSLEIEADLKAAQMLCMHGYSATVQAHVQSLSSAIAHGLVTYNILDHPSLEESLIYMQAFWNAYSQAQGSNQPQAQ